MNDEDDYYNNYYWAYYCLLIKINVCKLTGTVYAINYNQKYISLSAYILSGR